MNLLPTMDEDMDLAVSGDDECCQTLVSESDCTTTGSLLPADSVCRVCGDGSTGVYFGALVCVPCKVSNGVVYLGPDLQNILRKILSLS